MRMMASPPGIHVSADVRIDSARRPGVTAMMSAASSVVSEAVGPNAFDPIVEGLPAAGLKSIVAKLDKHHPELKGSTPAWQRKHLRSLLGGTTEPTQKATEPKRPGAQPKAAKPTRTPIGFKTEAMSVFRESLKPK